MTIKNGFTVYNHLYITGRSQGWEVTHFGSKTLDEAVKYCRENVVKYAEIKYGKYDDEKYNMREVGPQKTVGIVKRFKRKGTVKYVLIIGKKRFTVKSDGTYTPE